MEKEVFLMGRTPDYFIKDLKKNSIGVYKTPFTKDDYNFIINQDGCGDKFGIHDRHSQKVKFYDIGKGHIPTFNNLFNMDFNVDFFTTVKFLGLGVVGIWAYRLSRAVPTNPFKPSKESKQFVKDLLKNAEKPRPDIIHMGEGNGFEGAN